MVCFGYKAVNEKGEQLNGQMTALNKKEVVEFLRVQGLFALDIRERKKFSRLMFTRKKASFTDIAYFCKQFGFLLKSGFGVYQALSLMQKNVQKKAMQQVTAHLAQGVINGKSLHRLMDGEPMFPLLLCRMVEAGEHSGNLDEILLLMGERFTIKQERMNRYQNAVLYPAFIIVLMVIVVILSMVFVFPRYQMIYDIAGVSLPGVTVIFIRMSSWLRKYFAVVMLLLIFLPAIIKKASTLHKGFHFFTGKLLLKLPVLGRLHCEIIIAEFSEIMALLLEKGVFLLDALAVARKAVTNPVAKGEIERVQRQIRLGAGAGVLFQAAAVFTGVFKQMFMTGMETGRLDYMLAETAKHYYDEVNGSLNRIGKFLEPVLTLIIGLWLGFMMVAIMLPVIQMSNLL